MFSLLSALIAAPLLAVTASSSATNCPADSAAEYDYIVVGSGAGGGPTAARLALANYKVLLIDAGHDIENYNTTVPLYYSKVPEERTGLLAYWVQMFADNSRLAYYPRTHALGGSTQHYSLINLDHTEYDFNNLAKITGDKSWSYDNMRQFFHKVEKNIWLDPAVGKPAGHGYDGWLEIDTVPEYLYTMPQNNDSQLSTVYNAVKDTMLKTDWYPNGDISSIQANNKPGSGWLSLMKNTKRTRSSVRDHLIDTQAKVPTRLNFMGDTLVTKVLTCNADSKDATGAGLRAFGVTYANGAHLLPASTNFTGKAKLNLKTVTAKYEVIISAGVFQTPQLLMLSGIGERAQLKANGIETLVNLPGVGKNLQDRVENSIAWELKEPHKFYKGCTFGDDPKTDPCLQDWIDSNHTSFYAGGPGTVASLGKSKKSLPYVDLWTMWLPSRFIGYYPGFFEEAATYPNIWSAFTLKAHAAAQGWVRLNGSDPQDTLTINKNLFATSESKADLVALREEMKANRAKVAASAAMQGMIVKENWPGANVTTDAQLDEFNRNNHWGHHACCTAKIGSDKDADAVLDTKFQVRGVKRLRVVDISSWPNIPGLFVAAPTYVLSEKAASVIINDAAALRWQGSH